MNGILPVWKPPNCTSHDVVAKVRRLAKQVKVGHTGTLDPAAQGVLPLCLGRATRVVEYVQNLPKTYEGVLTLGIATDTQDQEGKVTRREPVRNVSKDKVIDVFRRFQGEIEQIPPMYSAVKIKGRRLYDWAREGKEIKRQARKVYIYRLELVHMRDGDFPQVKFVVQCSKGTYVRTLCVDVGRALGYPAHLSHLVRLKSGPYSREECVTLTQLEDTPVDLWSSRWLKPIDSGLVHFPAHTVPLEDRHAVVNGRPITLPEGHYQPGTLLRVYTASEFLALYRCDRTGKRARPVKVFAGNR